jgi:uncharacterized membrane protein YfcA
MFYTGLILSAVIGLSLGLIGGGGSILTVPILVYFLGVEPREAVAMSLAVVGATSLVGVFLHGARGNVNFSSAALFGFSGVFGAALGSPLTQMVAPAVLLLIFGALMLATAFSMLRRKSRETDDRELYETNKPKAALAGFGVGFLTGFLGVGGGFLIVPALVLFGGLAIKEAIGTSLIVIFMNCVAGLIGHFSLTAKLDWSLTLLVTTLAAGGAFFGSVLSQRLAAQRLRQTFAYLVLAVAVFMIAKNYTVLW